jgi:hypothetical protein
MRLLSCWKDSMSFFERKNISTLSLVTLKTIQTTYVSMMKYIGIPLCLLAVIDVFLRPNGFHIVHIAFFGFMYLTLRPSVERKSWHYYTKYLAHWLCLLVWLTGVFFLLGKVGYWWWSLVAMLVTCAVFFFLDSKVSLSNFIHAHVRAATMVVYNAPVSIFLSMVLMLAWALYMAIINMLSHYIAVPIAVASMLYIPIEAAVLSNMYIKWFHEQFSLYYVQPK